SVASVSGTTAASAKPLQEKPKAAATAPGVGKPLRTAPAASTTMAGAALPSGPRPVQAILIEGTINVKPSDISARLSTRIGANLTRDTLREDLKEIWSMNRFDDVTVDVSPMEGGYRVTFIVKERPIIREVKNIGIKE